MILFRTWGGALNFGSDGVLGQQLKTRGLSVRDFSPKKGGHSVRRPTKSGSNSENKTNFGTFSTQSMNLDTHSNFGEKDQI